MKDSTISLSIPSESKFLNHLAVISFTKAIVKGATIKDFVFFNAYFLPRDRLDGLRFDACNNLISLWHEIFRANETFTLTFWKFTILVVHLS